MQQIRLQRTIARPNLTFMSHTDPHDAFISDLRYLYMRRVFFLAPEEGTMLVRSLAYMLFGLVAAAHGATVLKSQELKLPLEFEANRGQFAPEVLFLARTSSHFVYLTREGITLGLSSGAQPAAALRMNFVNGNRGARVAPEGRLPGVSNYFVGNDPSSWQREVPHYGRVRYRSRVAGNRPRIPRPRPGPGIRFRRLPGRRSIRHSLELYSRPQPKPRPPWQPADRDRLRHGGAALA